MKTRRCPRGRRALALLALFAAGPLPAAAQSTLHAGTEFRVNEYTTGYQTAPVAAVEPSGTYLVVWSSNGQDGSGQGIFARRVDRRGDPSGSEFQVNQATTGDQRDPSVAVDPAGRITIAWAGGDGSGAGILARQFSIAGPLGPEFQVNTATAGDQSLPRVAAGPGGIYIVWQSPDADGSAGVAGRLFTRDGTPASPETAVPVQRTGPQVTPAVTALPNTWYVVAWNDNNPPPHAFARFVDPAGAPAGLQVQADGFQGTQLQERRHVAVAAKPNAEFVVAHWFHYVAVGDGWWNRDLGPRLQRFDSTGAPIASEFSPVSTMTNNGVRWEPALGLTSTGSLLTAWTSAPVPYTCIPPCLPPVPEDGSGSGVFARAFDQASNPLGLLEQVNSTTTGDQSKPAVAMDGAGNSLVVWQSQFQDGFGTGIYAQRLGGLFPAAVSVDPAPGNLVLDPGEVAAVRTAWTNLSGFTFSFAGSLGSFGGPAGGTYTVTDAQGSYGSVPDGATRTCVDCYAVSASFPGPRPAVHVDGSAVETLSPAVLGLHRDLVLHVGGSFADVASSSPFYRFVETLLHRGVTTGCGSGMYCPQNASTREQMAVFVLIAREGPGYAPPPCGTPLFPDVPASSPFCRWIEELSRRGVVGGCGGGNYCPSGIVTREQMPVFVLRTLDPTLDPPDCTAPLFGDVPASSPFCRWIEELARRGVVTGCGGGNYCPSATVTREQMAVFLAVTFGLTLY